MRAMIAPPLGRKKSKDRWWRQRVSAVVAATSALIDKGRRRIDAARGR